MPVQLYVTHNCKKLQRPEGSMHSKVTGTKSGFELPHGSWELRLSPQEQQELLIAESSLQRNQCTLKSINIEIF